VLSTMPTIVGAQRIMVLFVVSTDEVSEDERSCTRSADLQSPVFLVVTLY
jgi:hypothetical protein